MATTKKTDAADDAGQAEVQANVDEAEAKGYLGTAPDPNPNEAYSIQTGPDSPPAVADHQTRTAQHVAGVATKEA